MTHLKYLTICLSLFVACKLDKQKDTPDISNIKSDIHFYRFEKDLFQIDTNKIEAEVQNIIQKYPSLSRIFFQDIMQFTTKIDSADPKLYEMVKAFVRDPLLNRIQKRTDSIYGDMSDLKKSFDLTAAYSKYYFPEGKKIDVYTFISAFNVGNIIFEVNDSTDGLGISTDFFLGGDFNYQAINPNFELFSNYVTRSFNKEHILKKSWMPYVEDLVPDNNLNTLLDHMLYEGKKLYILSKLIPNIQDSVLFEFKPSQVEWCSKNKMNIWSFLKDKNLIQATKRNEIIRYLNPSPSSPGMPKESPGRAAVYIGYDIILSYMKLHPEMKLSEFAKIDNMQKILDESKYKPDNG